MIDDGAKSYLHADGILAEIDPANAASYHLKDALGSVRGVTDGTGALVGTSDYAAFGAVRATTGITSRFGYTGEQIDPETGNVYLRARYADPQLGRFLSMDTVQPNAPGTQGFNRCAYVANNSINWTDPTGHSAGSHCVETWGKIWDSLLGSIWGAAFGSLLMIRADKKGGALIRLAAGFAMGAGTYEGAQIFGSVLTWIHSGTDSGWLPVSELIISVGLIHIAGAIFVWGDPPLALATGFGILLAAVLIGVAAIAIRLITEWAAVASSLSRATCNLPGYLGGLLGGLLGGGSAPSARSADAPDGSNASSLLNNEPLMPRIPAPFRPLVAKEG